MRFLTGFFLSGCFLLAAEKSGPVEFQAHVVESKIPRGYAVLVTDMNGDGRPDIVGLTSQLTELAWYENPTWQRHVLVQNMVGLVNMAAHDIDGDGIPELAIANEFSMVAARSRGLVWLLHQQGDPRNLWKATLIDELATSHHLDWADIDGDGRKELINAPLIGPNAIAPRYEDRVPLVYYHVPSGLQERWRRLLIDDQLTGVLHRVRAVRWDTDQREELLSAGFDGIVLHRSFGEGEQIRWQKTLLSRGHREEPPRAGASDVAVGQLNQNRILLSVEPWHGNELVVYIQDGSAGWQRRVIYEGLKEGHEVCVADFNGDGRDDIVVGDRARGEISSSHLFYAQDDAGLLWRHQVLDPLGMSASGCSTADINGDGRMDIVQIGGATENIKWYENRGVRPSQPASHRPNRSE